MTINTDCFFETLDISGITNTRVFLDIDGTIVPDGAKEIDGGIFEKIVKLSLNNKVYLCTNKKQLGRKELFSSIPAVTFLDSPFRKPSKKILANIDNWSEGQRIVIGDKFLTDGLFACNIGAEFIKTKRMKSKSDSFTVKLIYFIDDIFWVVAQTLKQANYLISLARPKQWVKNLLVLVPIFFAKEIFQIEKLWAAFMTFVIFCLTASALYVVNDIFDLKNDREHPIKKNRPLASGAVSVSMAVIYAGVLFFTGIFLASKFVPQILWVMGVYTVLNLLYTVYLKHLVILDILTVAVFYLLRVVSGSVASSTFLSRWLILCLIFAALFVILGKRRAEFNNSNIRSVLKDYNAPLLDHLLTISISLTLVAYGIYCILGVSSNLAVYSILPALFGGFRYLYLIYTSPAVEFPEKVILGDKLIIGSVIVWLLFMFYIFYSIAHL